MVVIKLDRVDLEFKVRRYKRLSLKEFLVRGMFSKAANPVIDSGENPGASMTYKPGPGGAAATSIPAFSAAKPSTVLP